MDAQAVTRAKAPRRAPRRAGAPASQVDRLLARVAADYEALPRQLKSVARYVEQHRARVMVDRIGDVARECAVQPSAVVRFAQRFGYAGFSAMQAVFRDDYTQQAAAATSYQQRIRRLVTSKRRTLTPGAVAREFVAASTSGLEELARDVGVALELIGTEERRARAGPASGFSVVEIPLRPLVRLQSGGLLFNFLSRPIGGLLDAPGLGARMVGAGLENRLDGQRGRALGV